MLSKVVIPMLATQGATTHQQGQHCLLTLTRSVSYAIRGFEPQTYTHQNWTKLVPHIKSRLKMVVCSLTSALLGLYILLFIDLSTANGVWYYSIGMVLCTIV